jgi:hypothetical protein
VDKHQPKITQIYKQRYCISCHSENILAIFDEVTEEWRRLHNKELYALYSSPDIIRVIMSGRLRLAEHVARMRGRIGTYTILVGKPAGTRPLGRPRRTWENNIKMDLREVGWKGGGSDWINLAQDMDRYRAIVNAVMNLRVP